MRNSHVRCILASNEHGYYAVPISSEHRPASEAILAGRVHEPQTLAFMTEHCGNRDIVHAGAFFGDFLPALSKALDAKAVLWAFEPNPENYACANWTVRLNGLSNCRLQHAGLGSRNEIRPLYTHSRDNVALGGASTFVQRAGSSLDVNLVRVDDVVQDRSVGIIQLDVEHFEEQALLGALRAIQRNLPILILENLPSEAWWNENMKPLGYTKLGNVHNNHVFRA